MCILCIPLAQELDLGKRVTAFALLRLQRLLKLTRVEHTHAHSSIIVQEMKIAEGSHVILLCAVQSYFQASGA